MIVLVIFFDLCLLSACFVSGGKLASKPHLLRNVGYLNILFE